MRIRPSALLGSLCILSLFLACGGGSSTTTQKCTGSRTACSDRCVDLTTDVENCGACGTVCPAGEACTSGKCHVACASSEMACPTTNPTYCADIKTDSANCGGCGMACPAAQQCTNGTCACPAAAPDLCGTGQNAYCTDLSNDFENCGTCAYVCTAGSTCTNKTCGCPTGLTACSGSCVDTTTSFANCGSCGAPCAPDQVCVSSACVYECPPGTPTLCGSGATSACADTTSDPAHCGSCTTACPSGAACTNSACVCPLASPDACPSTGTPALCTTFATDPNNCGACGKACPAGEACENETCISGTDCAAIHVLAPSLPDGAYTIDPDGPTGPIAPFAVYCDMTSDGGGWTLALKANGHDTGTPGAARFAYGSTLWNTASSSDANYAFNTSSTDLTAVSAKFMSFNTLPYTQIRLAMSDTSTMHSLSFSLPGASAYESGVTGAVAQTSLQATFASGAFIPLVGTPTRSEWLSLVGTPALQANCNRGGLNNASPPYGQTRIGFLGNGDNNCASPDSYIGVGNDDASPCTGAINAYVGNMATCNLPGDTGIGVGGDRSTPEMAYVFVRQTDFRSVVPPQASCQAHYALGRTISGIYPISYGVNTSNAVYCDMSADGGGWTMAYKFSTGVSAPSPDAYAVWTGAASAESTPSVLNVRSSPKHYVGRIVTNDWNAATNGFTVTQARVVAYNGEDEAQSIRFNVPSGNTNWFAAANVATSTWTDLTTSQTYNFFSIAGDTYPAGGPEPQYVGGARRFFINEQSANTCTGDAGWLVVTLSPTEGCNQNNPNLSSGKGWWESQYATPPAVLYSNKATVETWADDAANIGVASTLVVYAR